LLRELHSADNHNVLYTTLPRSGIVHQTVIARHVWLLQTKCSMALFWGGYIIVDCIFAAYRLSFGVCWWQRIPHIDVFSKANITPLEHLLVQEQLHWLGHVIRLPNNRLLIDSSMVSSHRDRDWSAILRSGSRTTSELQCNIQLSDLEASASDRDVWRTVC